MVEGQARAEEVMLEIHYLSVVVAAVVAFVMSSIWYTIFGKARSAPGSRVAEPDGA